jgi:hypothetical protein
MGNLVCINLQYSVLPNQLEKQWLQTFYGTAANSCWYSSRDFRG